MLPERNEELSHRHQHMAMRLISRVLFPQEKNDQGRLPGIGTVVNMQGTQYRDDNTACHLLAHLWGSYYLC